jgi:hypothetical protein
MYKNPKSPEAIASAKRRQKKYNATAKGKARWARHNQKRIYNPEWWRNRHLAHRAEVNARTRKYAASVRGHFTILKSSAKTRKLEMLLNFEQYQGLVSTNECYYCHQPLPRCGTGLDRLDHRVGYILGNVVPCCKSCNEIKGKLEGAGFIYPRTVELMRELIIGRIQ